MPLTRYELHTKVGLLLPTTHIHQVVAAVPKQQPTLIVYVDPSNVTAFEKEIESNPKVLSYRADRRTPGIVGKEWKRA